MSGNEPLQKRAGANEPNRNREISIVPNKAGRAKSVVLNMDGSDIELVPPPDPSNKGRCFAVIGTYGYGVLGSVSVEEGTTNLEGSIIFIDANGFEFEAGDLSSPSGFEEVGLEAAPGRFPCLLNGEKLVFRPSSTIPDQRGLFFSAYHDTDAIGLRIPANGASEVEVVKAPPGKIVGFPSVKDPEGGIGPFAVAGGPEATGAEIYFYLEDPEGVRVFLGAAESDPGIEWMDLEGVLTLAPGERVVAVPVADVGPGVTICCTIALINAANE
jgi:hypothetical protein